MNKLKKNPLLLFFIICALESMAANFAHPITPTLIKNLNLNDYMFGVAFAGMAFTNFFFSPFWGKISDKIGDVTVMAIGCVGYGIGQLAFAISVTELQILLARMLSGFFVGGIFVCFLTYVVRMSSLRERGRNLTIYATITTVFSTFGYLAGGLMGDYSIMLTFIVQSATLIASGILFKAFLKEGERKQEKVEWKGMLKESNPFKALLSAKSIMTKLLFVLFMVVLLASLASTAYEQSFNYFIKDQFNFKPSYNGIIKAAIGILSLLVNSTLCMWIVKYKDCNKYLIGVLSLCTIATLAVIGFEQVVPFIIINLVYFAVNSIYIPLLQNTVASQGTEKTTSMVMGFYNSIKSLGMIIGSLLAGFIYNLGPNLAFVFGGVFFLLAVIFMVYYYIKAPRSVVPSHHKTV